MQNCRKAENEKEGLGIIESCNLLRKGKKREIATNRVWVVMLVSVPGLFPNGK